MVKRLLSRQYSLSLFGKKYHQSETRLADLITRLSGSMIFVYLHILVFTLFFIFRPFQVEVFNIFLSLEAVFLATFIMIAQNRQAEIDEQRAAEEEEDQEEIAEDIEDIQEDFDTVQKDLTELRKLITKIEERYSTSDFRVEKEKEKVAASAISPKRKALNQK